MSARELAERDAMSAVSVAKILSAQFDGSDDEFNRLEAVVAAQFCVNRERTLEWTAAQCQRMAVERFDKHGVYDVRGAALWDVSTWLREDVIPEATSSTISAADVMRPPFAGPSGEGGGISGADLDVESVAPGLSRWSVEPRSAPESGGPR